MNRFVVALAGVLLVAAACGTGFGGWNRVGSPPYERGSGTAGTETRALTAFHAVAAAQGIAVTVEQGSADSAVIHLDDNLLGHVETVVESGTLHVRLTGNIETHVIARVEVVATTVLDSVSADTGASLDLRHVDATQLGVRASTGARVHLDGRADALDLRVDMGSTAELEDLSVAKATVAIATGSRANVRAEQAVSGSCTVGSTLHLVSHPDSQTVSTDFSSSVVRD